MVRTQHALIDLLHHPFNLTFILSPKRVNIEKSLHRISSALCFYVQIVKNPFRFSSEKKESNKSLAHYDRNNINNEEKNKKKGIYIAALIFRETIFVNTHGASRENPRSHRPLVPRDRENEREAKGKVRLESRTKRRGMKGKSTL